jgi:hypothetical protein
MANEYSEYFSDMIDEADNDTSEDYQYDDYGNRVFDDGTDETEAEVEKIFGDEEGEDVDESIEPPDDDVEDSIVVEVPDFIPDDLIAPEFDNEQQELDWYREHLPKIYNVFASDSFKESMMDSYEDYLIAKEKDVEKLKVIKEALEGNPERAFKQFMPHVLQQNGIRPVFNSNEIDSFIEEKLKAEFGVEYKDLIVPEDLFRPSSLTSQIYARQQDLLKDYEQHNAQYSNTAQSTVDPTILREKIEQDKKTYFSHVDEHEFDGFLKEIEAYDWDLSDFEHAYNFHQYIETAGQMGYDQGYDEGKKSVLQEITRAGRMETYDEVIDQRLNIPTSERDLLRSLNVQQY